MPRKPAPGSSVALCRSGALLAIAAAAGGLSVGRAGCGSAPADVLRCPAPPPPRCGYGGQRRPGSLAGDRSAAVAGTVARHGASASAPARSGKSRQAARGGKIQEGLCAATIHTASPTFGFSGAERRELLRRFGDHAAAYASVAQEGLQFFDVEGLGFVSYRAGDVLGRINLVFARPVCARDDVAALLDRFLAEVPGQMIFSGMDEATARFLKNRGYSATVLGTDFHIPVQEFSIAGRRMNHLRRIRNFGARGLTVREQAWGEVDHDAVRAISVAWLRTKSGRAQELELLTRPPVYADEWQVRKFYVYGPDGAMLGFAFFDPYFSGGDVVGYTANILRAWPEARPSGLLDYAMVVALEKFRAEGVASLSLGLAVLHGLRHEPGDCEALAGLLATAYEYGNAIYPFKSLGAHKLRWRAENETLYACTKDVNPFAAVLFTLQATNAI